MMGRFEIEDSGTATVVRLFGVPSVDVIRGAHEQILSRLNAGGPRSVIYDGRAMEPPTVEVPLSQWLLDRDFEPFKLRRAVIVPDTKLAYLARLAFHNDDFRVFYNDYAAALEWLESP